MNSQPPSAPPPTPAVHRGRLTRIFLLSTLIAYVEMLLIRWIGTEIRVFAYLQNAVLVAGDPVDATMLLLGAGFMLLEVTGVSRAALTAITLAVYLGARLALGRKGRATSSRGQDAPC